MILEYPVEEAEELLRKNLETAQSSLKQVEEDLDFLKDQCTTTEVGILHWLIRLLTTSDLSGENSEHERMDQILAYTSC